MPKDKYIGQSKVSSSRQTVVEGSTKSGGRIRTQKQNNTNTRMGTGKQYREIKLTGAQVSQILTDRERTSGRAIGASRRSAAVTKRNAAAKGSKKK